MKNSSDTIGNRTRNFLACSAVPVLDTAFLKPAVTPAVLLMTLSGLVLRYVTWVVSFLQ
jgi:hypothetical protein